LTFPARFLEYRPNEREEIMPKMERKNMSKPDELRTFDKGQLELATLGGVTFARATFQPGWKWSTCVKPLMKTKSCELSHLTYHVSGRFAVLMDDGSRQEIGAGRHFPGSTGPRRLGGWGRTRGGD
jgi:hypothetical protein